MAQRTVNFISLAFDDYIAARLLLRNGLLSQGVAVAATAVEKQLKALLALNGATTKRHLDPSLFTKVNKLEPELAKNLSRDFIKFLSKGFMLRYASIDAGEFGIVINQYRTLVELDKTVLNIDSGFRISKNEEPQETPLQVAIKSGNRMVLDDNVPLGIVTFESIRARPNKIHELKVGKNLQTLSVQYETEGLNIVGEFCKKTDIEFGKQKWQLALG